MASGTLADFVLTQSFSDYADLATKQSSKLVTSGVLEMDPELQAEAGGSSNSITMRFMIDITGSSNVSDDSNTDGPVDALKGPGLVVPRLVRNKSVGYKSVVVSKSNPDPAAGVAEKMGRYWGRQLDSLSLLSCTGVFADNAAAPSGSDTHAQNDLTNDIKGSSYSAGVTDFSIAALEAARAKMGDALGDLRLVLVHPVVYAKMTDAMLASLRDRGITLDYYDQLPVASGVYESWLFGAGAIKYAIVDNKEGGYEPHRKPLSGNGGGETIITTRRDMFISPPGVSFIGATTTGLPSDATLAAAASWSRLYPERKQVAMGRLITRES